MFCILILILIFHFHSHESSVTLAKTTILTTLLKVTCLELHAPRYSPHSKLQVRTSTSVDNAAEIEKKLPHRRVKVSKLTDGPNATVSGGYFTKQ